MTKLLEGKKGLILGVANKRSIAWGIAQSAAEHGAQLAFSYQGERLKENVEELANTLSGSLVLPCDVMDESQVDKLFADVDKAWGGLDFVAHCIAYAKAEDISGRFVDTSKDGYDTALGVSAYSFTLISKKAEPLFEKRGGGSLITLTYLGAQRVMPNYNVMGVAKAALEAGVHGSDVGAQADQVLVVGNAFQRFATGNADLEGFRSDEFVPGALLRRRNET